jgi:hypothetical protein
LERILNRDKILSEQISKWNEFLSLWIVPPDHLGYLIAIQHVKQGSTASTPKPLRHWKEQIESRRVEDEKITRDGGGRRPHRLELNMRKKPDSARDRGEWRKKKKP